MNTLGRADVQVTQADPAMGDVTMSDIDVVFKGDGEPTTPAQMIRRLAEFHDNVGLEPDSYSLGGTVQRLEQRFAEMLGKEAAAFMPTGTLANHLAIRKHCGVRPRSIVQEQSHLYNDTGDSVTRLSGINLVPLGKGRPYFTLDELKEAMVGAETGRVANAIGAVMVESPVRRQAGQVVPYTEMAAITAYSAERGVPTHLDGARLYMMSAATGVKPEEYAGLFDTVYVSIYKYFGAPYGAILAGTSVFIEDIYHDRRMFGGGLASAYMAAGLALEGTEGFQERFAAAMERAAALVPRLNALPGIALGRFEHGSNIFPMDVEPTVDVDQLVSSLRQRRVFLYPTDEAQGRVLLSVNTTILRQSEDDLVCAFEEALRKSRKIEP